MKYYLSLIIIVLHLPNDQNSKEVLNVLNHWYSIRKTQAKHITPVEESIFKAFCVPRIWTLLIKFSCIYLQRHYHKLNMASMLLHACGRRGQNKTAQLWTRGTFGWNTSCSPLVKRQTSKHSIHEARSHVIFILFFNLLQNFKQGIVAAC